MTKLVKWPGSKLNAAKTVGPILLGVVDPTKPVTLIEPFFGSGAMTKWVEANVESSLHVVANEYNYALAKTFEFLYNMDVEERKALVDTLNDMSEKWAAKALNAPMVEREMRGGKKKVLQWSEEAEVFYEATKSSLNSFNARRWGASEQVVPLFLLFNRITFNGLYRESKKSGLNVPIGRNNKGCYNKTPNWVDVINQPWIKRLESFSVNTLDFATFLRRLERPEPNSVLYVDPPYIGKFSQYNSDGFGLDRHIELVRLCEKVHRDLGVPVVYSNSGGGKELLGTHGNGQWEVTEFYSKTSVSCASDKGKLDEIVGVLR